MEFNQTSYEKHTNMYSKTDLDTMNKWTQKNTVDYWRHKRMYDTMLPLLSCYKDASWLTIGDGRYGTDANYLLQYTKNVVASDIAEECLKVAKENNFIQEYKIENAESLSFENNSFDFVVCKEAYHHFPRPMIAVYEMIRVAKNAIILIEPNDSNTIIPQQQSFASAFFWFKQSCKNAIKKLLNKPIFYHQGNYEDVGNYVFSISEREIEKVGLGLNLDMVAFKGINDYYIEGVESELLENNGPLFNTIKNNIAIEDNLVKKGARKPGLLTAILFKKMPSDECISALKKDGFSITKLTKNPYL